jgi:hypothetical protein
VKLLLGYLSSGVGTGDQTDKKKKIIFVSPKLSLKAVTELLAV